MSEENVENARRGYAVMNEAYRAGDPSIFRLHRTKADALEAAGLSE